MGVDADGHIPLWRRGLIPNTERFRQKLNYHLCWNSQREHKYCFTVYLMPTKNCGGPTWKKTSQPATVNGCVLNEKHLLRIITQNNKRVHRCSAVLVNFNSAANFLMFYTLNILSD